ncbi:MAG: acetyl-CoA carboxylase carboxyltransferase subunit alpha [Bacteroidia bacterium]|nr:acetyl-CoA carboxylase carboxyltransferase subunit alpha [Bacteroidia bacterium]MCO5253919.1 acetyl-CoA carboxylase carboxyltransferase subunit alpha [Bacteroidota bacterium]MCZ2128890.1 acetyl-CoA carboxylase carboxyltransferase subunit alpha [Bacteroidia bacterium]
MNYLDFEKPVEDLCEQLDKVKETHSHGKVDMTDTIAQLEKKIDELKKEVYGNLSNWQRVQLSRHPDRPYTLDYIQNIAPDFIELHGDRVVNDDKAIVGGFGTIDGQTFMIIGQQKGRNTKERQYRNFGMANPDGYRKALRLMKLAEKFNKPILTLIDTPGASPGLEAEERGQGEAIAKNLMEMAVLKTPVICVVIGEGASGGALGIGVGDKVMMMEYSWYSVISPENCSSILWRSWDYKEKAADALKLTPQDMLTNKLIDGIIEEPLGGAHYNPQEAAEILKREIKRLYKSLKDIPADKIIESRIAKFSEMGAYKLEAESQS